MIMLDSGENVEDKLASERVGELVKRRQRGQKHWRHGRVTKQEQRASVRVCARHRQKRRRRSNPTWNGTRKLDPKSRATWNV